jgi:hypothetical protein
MHRITTGGRQINVIPMPVISLAGGDDGPYFLETVPVPQIPDAINAKPKRVDAKAMLNTAVGSFIRNAFSERRVTSSLNASLD